MGGKEGGSEAGEKEGGSSREAGRGRELRVCEREIERGGMGMGWKEGELGRREGERDLLQAIP